MQYMYQLDPEYFIGSGRVWYMSTKFEFSNLYVYCTVNTGPFNLATVGSEPMNRSRPRATKILSGKLSGNSTNSAATDLHGQWSENLPMHSARAQIVDPEEHAKSVYMYMYWTDHIQ